MQFFKTHIVEKMFPDTQVASKLRFFFKIRYVQPVHMSLPREIWSHIFSYVPCGSAWGAIMKLNKLFNELGFKAFDMSTFDNRPLRLMVDHGYPKEYMNRIVHSLKTRTPSWNEYHMFTWIARMMPTPKCVERRQRYLSTFKLLLEHPDCTPNCSTGTGMISLIGLMFHKNYNYELTEMLLKDKRVDPFALVNGRTLVNIAFSYFECRRDNLLQLFKCTKVDRTADNYRVLISGAYYGFNELVKLILNEDENIPLETVQRALRSCSNSGVKNLLEQRVRKLTSQ